MDFGEAHFILSCKLKNSVLKFESREIQGRFYQYRRKETKELLNGQINEYWMCIDCEKLRKLNGPENGEMYSKIIVSNGRLLRNPEIGHHTQCTGKTFGEINAQILDRDARNMCKIGAKRPLEANTYMNSEVVKRFRNQEAAQVEENLPEYSQVKSSLRRWLRKGRIPVENAYDLPQEYQVRAHMPVCA